MEKLKNLHVIIVLIAQKEDMKWILFQNEKHENIEIFDHIEIYTVLKIFFFLFLNFTYQSLFPLPPLLKLNLHKSKAWLLVTQEWEQSHPREYLNYYNLIGCFLWYKMPQTYLNCNIKWRKKNETLGNAHSFICCNLRRKCANGMRVLRVKSKEGWGS